MKSITIHKIEPDLATKLAQRAHSEGTSKNKLVKAILRSALGLSKAQPMDHSKDFEDLFGSWSKEERDSFEGRVDAARVVNPQEWER